MQTHLFPLFCSTGAASKKLASSVLLAGAASKKPCSVGLARGAPVAPWWLWHSPADGAPRPSPCGVTSWTWHGADGGQRTSPLGAARTKLDVRALAPDRRGWCKIEGVESSQLYGTSPPSSAVLDPLEHRTTSYCSSIAATSSAPVGKEAHENELCTQVLNIAGAAAVTTAALDTLGCHVQRVPKN